MSAGLAINGDKVLDRAAFLGKRDTVEVQRVFVPALGGTVYVRVFSGRARDAWEIAMREQREGRRWNVRALMVALGACDADGAPLFSLADVDALGELDWRELDIVADKVDALNALSAGAREDLAGNSSGGPTGASGSGSPDTSS